MGRVVSKVELGELVGRDERTLTRWQKDGMPVMEFGQGRGNENQYDTEAVIHLLESAVAARGESESPLGALLAQARAEKLGLRPLAARLAALIGIAAGIVAWRAAATPALRAKVQEWLR